MNDESALGQESWESESVVRNQTTARTREVTKRFNLRRWVLVWLGISILSGLAVGVTRLVDTKSDNGSYTDTRILQVKTVPLKAVKSYSVKETYTGEVVAVRASELGFERSGKIIWLNVDRGEWVKARMPIAKLDTQNLEAQRQQLLAQQA
jgi:multidrug efflux pump subunit AcrA (membrane-fusion protein)